MSAEDKAKNTAEKAAGTVKEGAGKVTGNESLEAEGRGDQAKGQPQASRRESQRRLQEVADTMNTARKSAPGSVPGIRSWRHRMAGHVLRQRVEVSDDDRTVATAEVTTSEGSGGTARVSLRAEPGHITPGRRASLVDAVLDLPEVQESARVEAAFRLGDDESLHRLQERCEDVSTRPAGWSALLDASLPSSRAGQHVPDSPARNP